MESSCNLSHPITDLASFRTGRTLAAPPSSPTLPGCPRCGLFRHDSAYCESCEALTSVEAAIQSLETEHGMEDNRMAAVLAGLIAALDAINKRVIAGEYTAPPVPTV
jgi:hypothetical protein